MKVYHGTSRENWEKIKQEGVLWGYRGNIDRCSYLATDEEEAKRHGDVLLEIDYNPKQGKNNYKKGCWQIREYEPINIKNINEI